MLCNDRAVIVGDKSRLTGWGDGIPLYHPQFAIITGIIEFRSKHADKLPVTTTKRALDTSSNVWLESLVKMKEGMRVWIDVHEPVEEPPALEQQQASHWEDARPMPLSKAIEAVAPRKATKKSDDDGVEFNPQEEQGPPRARGQDAILAKDRRSRALPRKCGSSRRCCSTTRTRSPAIVGDKCFDLRARQGQEAGG